MVAKDLYQWLVVSDNDKVVAPLHKVPSLFEAPGYGQGFTFDRCLAVERKYDPARVIFHPSWQQSGIPEVQLQCCWSKKLMPHLDQSEQRHVRLCTSKISMPSWISFTISCLEAWKTFSTSEDHEKRSYCISQLSIVDYSVDQLRMSEVDTGEAKSRMASGYLGSGSIVVSDTLKPAKLTSLSAN